ncbi:MAG: RecX family transcriptional regulator [Spirochaetes bacterium]|nr:RecX family transcriptional regulator [Spirochaetota bacterium]
MAQITEIRYTDSYIRIDLDTGETFKMSPEVYSMYSVSREQVLDTALYQQLKEESDRWQCRQKALNYLAMRSHSAQEMKTYLYKKGFSKDIIDEILAGLKDAGYIDDYDFAVRFINSKIKSRVVGENLLKRDLYKKGVSREIINKAIKATEAGNTDINDIYDLALKKLCSLENRKNKTAKLVYFLQQKGFSESRVRQIIDRLKNEEHI